MHSAYSSIIFSGLCSSSYSSEQRTPSASLMSRLLQPSCRSKCRTFGTGSFPSSHSIMSFSRSTSEVVPLYRLSVIFKYRFSFSPTSLYTLAGDIPSVSFTQRYFSISFFNSGDILILAIYYFLPLFYSIFIIFTASPAGLIFSPPNGSKPVNSILILSCLSLSVFSQNLAAPVLKPLCCLSIVFDSVFVYFRQPYPQLIA